jgi:phosphoribosylanthranilate isomerase
MEIKICGITNLEDAVYACMYGADAVGFIFYEPSPRYISPEKAKGIIDKLAHDMTVVGVFVNEDSHVVKSIVEFCGLDLIQLHGDESPEYCVQFPGTTLIKAFSPRSEEDLSSVKNYPVKAILIDSRDSGLYGGTGKKSKWELAARLREKHALVLAGGLNADNILTAMNTVMPHAVDVNSGVEISPRKKDPQKMKHLIDLVHMFESDSPMMIFQ